MHYKIKQIKDLEKCEYIFRDYDVALKRNFSLDDYEVVYEGDYPEGDNPNAEVEDYLESLFAMFNYEHPDGFTGHSLSVSDIIEWDGKNYYVNGVGFVEVQ